MPARPSRRAVLLAGAAAAVGAVPAVSLLTRAVAAGDGPPVPRRSLERLYSPSRGREVELAVLRPHELPTPDLPVCVFLHGLGGNGRSAFPSLLEGLLVAGVEEGLVPPFAFVALDGGNHYWHENNPGDDPMGMLLDDLPVWLAERGQSPQPFACAGISMGGFGALLYGRRRRERGFPASAVAAISPGLLTSWREMAKRKAFKDEAEWSGLDPLRNADSLGATKVGIWCGTEDKFIEGARRFIRQNRPAHSYLGPGGHEAAFYDRVTADVLHFLAQNLPR